MFLCRNRARVMCRKGDKEKTKNVFLHTFWFICCTSSTICWQKIVIFHSLQFVKFENCLNLFIMQAYLFMQSCFSLRPAINDDIRTGPQYYFKNSPVLHSLKSYFFWLAVSKCTVIYHWHVCDTSQRKCLLNLLQNCLWLNKGFFHFDL